MPREGLTGGIRARAVWGAAAVMLALAAFSTPFWGAVPGQPGADFYQFWGLAKVQRDSRFALGSPYRNPDAYQAALADRAARSGDERLRAAVALRERPDATGTPFIYAFMGQLPERYSPALAHFRIAQLLAFALAVFVLARPLAPPLACALLGLATAAAFDSLLLDVAVGNLSSLQLAGLVGVVVLLERHRVAARPTALAAAAMLLALLVLAKPIVALACGLLGLGLLRAASRSGKLIVVAAGAATCAMAFAWSCLLFGTDAWAEWSNEALSSTARLAYETGEGNRSGVTLLAAKVGIEARWVLGGLSALLAGSLAWVALRRGTARSADFWRLLDEPLALAALGILALLALSPLVWSHYQVLGVIPALWLCRTADVLPRALGWVSLVLLADPVRRVAMYVGDLEALWSVQHAFSWAPMWLGFLLVLDGWLRGASPAATSAAAPR